MRTIIYYYSMTGRSEELARRIAAELQCDAEPILEARRRISRGFLRFLSGGAAKAGQSAQIRQVTNDPSDYDRIILVSPIWASSPTPALRGFAGAHRDELEGKRLGLILTNLGSDPSVVFAQYDSILPQRYARASFTKGKGDWEEARERELIRSFIREIS